MAYPPIELVKEIIDLFNKSGASELEFGDSAIRFRIARHKAEDTAAHSKSVDYVAAEIVDRTPSAVEPSTSEFPVNAFMHGVFHRAPAPDADSFVEVGAVVVEGQQLGILEAMKVFMPILSPTSGIIARIHAGNGAEVVAGRLLMSISQIVSGEAT